jgi:hypothetical protein
VGNSGSTPRIGGKNLLPRQTFSHLQLTESSHVVIGRTDGATVSGKLDPLFRSVERGRKSQLDSPERAIAIRAIRAETIVAGDNTGRGEAVGAGPR